MEIVINALTHFSAMLRPHLGSIAMALIATLLVVYGADLNRVVQEMVRRLHFLLRVFIFMLVCAFGYGALVNYFTPLLVHLLAAAGAVWLGPVVVAAFLLVGYLAERRHYGS
ncbi:MAG: DUF3392 domain-containing protein [Pseudomonadota bacterium]